MAGLQLAGMGGMKSGSPVAFWVRGNSGVLESHSFASCVGLVLYGDKPGFGAVAHFWHPAGLNEAVQIAESYMKYVGTETGGFQGDDIQVLVFAGIAVNSSKSATGVKKNTYERVDQIAAHMKTRWALDNSQIIIDKTGSRSVTLDLNMKSDFLKDCYELATDNNLAKANASKGGMKGHRASL